jgi:signal transduction histidine kinase
MVEIIWQVDAGSELPGGSFPVGSGFTSQVIRTGQPRLIRRWSSEGPRVQLQYASGQPGLPESAIAVPLRLAGELVGVLSIQSYREEAYTQADVATLQALADQAALAIANLQRSELLDDQVMRRASELEAILSSMADALLILDAEDRVIRLNPAARKLLNVEETSIILGQPLDEEQWGQWPLGAQVLAKAIAPMLRELRETGLPQEVEAELHLDGRRTFAFSATPLYHGDESAGTVIIARDATGAREMEKLKTEMLSIASHDLKTPATVIKAQAQLLRRKAAAAVVAGVEFQDGLTMIVDQSNRLTKLLNLLLDLSKAEAGRLDLQLGPVDMRAMLSQLCAAIQTTTDRHTIVVRAPKNVVGEWDQGRLEEVVQNLVANAVKYSPDGGRVEVVLERDDRTATVCVHDQGVGLSPEDAPHVFERFWRAQGTRRLEGTGLGLYICQAIVDAHGGRIWAESAGLGQGSTFGFTLPVRSPFVTLGETDRNEPAHAGR